MAKGSVRQRRHRQGPKLSAEYTPRFWESLDGRTAVAKEIKARVDAMRQDAGADSVQKRALCDRAVFLTLLLERSEVDFAATGELDVGVYTQATNALSGLLSKLGLQPNAKSGPSLTDVIAKSKRRGRDED